MTDSATCIVRRSGRSTPHGRRACRNRHRDLSRLPGPDPSRPRLRWVARRFCGGPSRKQGPLEDSEDWCEVHVWVKIDRYSSPLKETTDALAAAGFVLDDEDDTYYLPL